MNTNVIELSTLIYYYSTVTLLLLITCMEGIYNYIPETMFLGFTTTTTSSFWFIQYMHQ